ncbi:MAG: AAA family ATPase [Leptolyngbya sp. Prado105]|jgi:DNA sulfur modification protein DndD|nr:AAA family ATPase [Leptolyngbya sp. Prado105]
MRLLSIRLCNFRQFYGRTPEVILASGDRRKITVIHGNNGAGKTGLLNAFTWVLYEKFTAAFASEDQLVNKRAIAEAAVGETIECWAEVVFEHGGTQYQAKRVCRAYKQKDGVEQGKSELRLLAKNETGRWLPTSYQPEDVIGRILPESLHRYFFFDGERIEQIVRSNKKAEIAEATKILLGVEVLNRSVKHLGEARKSLEKELGQIGDPETQKLLKQKEKLEQERDRLLERQDEIERELGYQDEIKQTTSQRLRELAGVEQLQQRRDDLEAQEKLTREKLRQSRANLRQAISSRGYMVLLGDATAQFRSIVDGLRQRGELPADIKQQFVQDLLTRNRCICGTELAEGSEPHRHVKAYWDKAGLADVEETVIRMGAQVDAIDRQVPEFWQEVDQEQANINQFKLSLSHVEEALESIREKLRQSPSEDIRKLQSCLDEVEQKIRELTLEQGANQQQIKDWETQMEGLGRQIEKHRMSETRQEQVQRRITAAEDAIARLKQVQEGLGQLFRLQLEKRVQEIFGQISFTPYVPRLNEKYELTLEETMAGQPASVAASTGENQILSLSFIGAIIDRIREWSKGKSGILMPDSSTFPIVMDSPFGSLDEIYRRQVARAIPVV